MRHLYVFLCSFMMLIASCGPDGMPVPEEEEQAPPPVGPPATATWMQDLLNEFPDRDIALRDISLPRSHDAGMYIIQNCSIGANACNVQTQHQDMKAQLNDGIRNFDVRPIFKNNVYFTRHSQSCDGLGCYGVRLENMFVQLREFLDEHAELVIIDLGHWCYTDGNDPGLRDLVTGILGDRLYREAVDPGTPFIFRPLRDILPEGQTTGLAVFTADGLANTADNRAAGFFSTAFINRTGSYANAQNFADMEADQRQKFNNFNENGDRIFELSWTLTQNAELAVACAFPANATSIEDMAATANPNLDQYMQDWMDSGLIRQGRIPNIIGVDFCESFVTDVCIRLSKFNLE